MNITVNTLTDQQWDTSLACFPDHSLYHHAEWKEIINDSFGHPAYYLVAQENDTVCGLLPLIHIKSMLFGSSLCSIPFFNYGGICASSKQSEMLLWEYAKGLAQELDVDFLEIRSEQELSIDAPCRTHKVTFHEQLTDTSESMWKHIGSKTRNQIRKAEHAQVVFRMGKKELIDSYYTVFSENMRDLGTPVYSKNFFKTICNRIKEEEYVIAVVTVNEKPAAAAFLLSHMSKLEIPWASSLRKYNTLCVNMYLYWNIMEYAIKKNYTVFDFGRCTKGSGTYKFKKQWGGQEMPLYWYYWSRNNTPPSVNPDNKKYKMFISLWTKLPLCIANAFGPLLIKNIP